MKILILANKMPYPPRDGGSVATLSLARALSDLGNEVTLLAMNTSKHYCELNKIPQDLQDKIRFIGVSVNTKIYSHHALRNFLFSSLPYNAERFVSADFRKKLSEVLKKEDFDLIQLEGLYLAPYVKQIREHTGAIVAMRSHNVEHEIWQRTTQQCSGLKKSYISHLTSRIHDLETGTLNDCDLMIPITHRDADRFKELGCEMPMHVVQTGFDLEKMGNEDVEEEFPSIFHLGALDWIPNQEGLVWFLNNAWHKIHERFPDLKFYLAGRNAPEHIKKLKFPNLVFLGEVDDAHAFMASKSTMVVPLLSGSGMRIKIIEGMALKRSIVSTDIGTEGIPTTNNENILLANSADEFIKQITRLVSDRALHKKIGSNAFSFVKENFDNLALAKSLIDFYTLHLK